jgi:predicted RNA-binding protein with PUA-like domain
LAYWLFKSEPDEFSIDDLAALGNAPEPWDGIRNYQARNLLRDRVAEGDEVLIYHSSCRTVGVAGTGKVVRAAYPDPAQFDPDSKYYDPRASRDNVRWYCVDVIFGEKFPEVLPLAQLKQMPGLENMVLLKQGRLSVQPVTASEWRQILEAAR